MGSSKGTTKTSNTYETQTYTPRDLGDIDELENRAFSVSKIPFQRYLGELVAPINQQQRTGFGTINNAVGSADPYFASAYGLTQRATTAPTQFSGAEVAKYMSPYQDSVIGSTLARIQDQDAQQQQQLSGNLTSSGAWGGDRAGIARAALAGQQSLSRNQTIAGLENQGYAQALGQYNAEQSRDLQNRQNYLNAAQLQSGIGTQRFQTGLAGGQAQIGAGTLEQQTRQAQNDAAYKQFMREVSYPFQTTQWLSGIGSSLLPLMGGTTEGFSNTTTKSSGGGNGIGQILGGLLSLGSMFMADGGRVGGEPDFADGSLAGAFMEPLPYSMPGQEDGVTNVPIIIPPKSAQHIPQLHHLKDSQEEANRDDRQDGGDGGMGKSIGKLGGMLKGLFSGDGGDGMAHGGAVPYDDADLFDGPSFDNESFGRLSEAFRADAPEPPMQLASLASDLPEVGGNPNQFGGLGAIEKVAPRSNPVFQSDDALAREREAIAAVESRGSGDYGALGPRTKRGDRAYGRYQVMGANIPSWTKDALGESMTPEQFLRNPEAQDAVFNHQFGLLKSKYGSAQDAASAWFTGRPLSRGASAADITGTTGSEYVSRFNKALGDPGLAYNDQTPTSFKGVGAAQTDAPVQTASLSSSASPATGGQQTATDAPSGGGLGGILPASGKGLFGISDEQRQALLAAGLAMMASNSRSVGQAIGEGGLAGLKAFQVAQANTKNKGLEDLRMENIRSEIEARKVHTEQAAKQLQLQAEQAARKLQLGSQLGSGIGEPEPPVAQSATEASQAPKTPAPALTAPQDQGASPALPQGQQRPSQALPPSGNLGDQAFWQKVDPQYRPATYLAAAKEAERKARMAYNAGEFDLAKRFEDQAKAHRETARGMVDKPVLMQDGSIAYSPSYIAAQKALSQSDHAPKIEEEAAARQRLVLSQGGDPKEPRNRDFIMTGKFPREDAAPLTATDKKAVLEADEMVSSNEAAIAALEQAKKVSPNAYGGWGAGMRAGVGQNIPDILVPDLIASPDRSEATQDLENIVTSQALANLKSIFGAAPTEGERKILLEIQGSVDKKDEIRQKIYDRAILAAKRRLEFNRTRANELRGGEYYKPNRGDGPVSAGPTAKEDQKTSAPFPSDPVKREIGKIYDNGSGVKARWTPDGWERVR